MKYLLYLKQNGEGCDYTIGCGETLIEIKAAYDNDAIDVAKYEILDNYTGDQKIIKAILIKNSEVLPVHNWYKQKEEEDRIQKLKEENEEEYNQYIKLKEKFEK